MTTDVEHIRLSEEILGIKHAGEISPELFELIDQRRCKRIAIDDREMLHYATDTPYKHDIVESRVQNWPEDVQVVRGPFYDPSCMWTIFIVAHESFEPVPEGTFLPVIEAEYKITKTQKELL